MQSNMQQSLSFIDVLTRNLFLLTIMCICIGLGIVVHLLNIESLDTYFIQIQSDRLDFIFFIGMAACYISLLFILIEKYWVNFFTQLLSAALLFILLIFAFNPSLRVKIYLFNHHSEFATRSWDKVKQLPVAKMVSFSWLQIPNEHDQLSAHGVVCPTTYSRYFLSFVFISYEVIPEAIYDNQTPKMAIECNNKTKQFMQLWPSREKALLAEDYQYFLKLDDNLMDEAILNQPLAVSIDQLPMSLQQGIQNFYSGTEMPLEQMTIKSSLIREVLEVKQKGTYSKRKVKNKG
ncbi:hypothetical protein [Entomomonas asaccharolytica]|uniref:Uncharacterized protein n=1 Tax=Entomomonas asaccharolytica TaxID=2785331 RepID=A0A974RW84_9GAMM|nr:hypothetical protein [Entomomonas asaccharolytica]QQP84862.1 hypothetical protein JHT90_10680 [Entomomonas asaccharolytica]